MFNPKIIQYTVYEGLTPEHKPNPIRIQFANQIAALDHRKTTGCGGWILGRFLYPGTYWTPSKVMEDCPDIGQLK